MAKIVFEDGSEQTSSMQGLPQVDISYTNGGRNYWLRLEDNGKHIWTKYGYAVRIPAHNRQQLPIGYAITIITEGYNSGVVSENNDDYILGSGQNGTGNGSCTIPRYTMATLVKIASNTWMLAGPGIYTGW